jgi:hypothetical protein
MKQSCREAREPEPIKIRGNLVLLKKAVAVAGLSGKWFEKPNGVWRYRSDCRAGLNWSGRRRTVSFEGPPAAREKLSRAVQAAVRSGVGGLYR